MERDHGQAFLRAQKFSFTETGAVTLAKAAEDVEQTLHAIPNLESVTEGEEHVETVQEFELAISINSHLPTSLGVEEVRPPANQKAVPFQQEATKRSYWTCLYVSMQCDDSGTAPRLEIVQEVVIKLSLQDTVGTIMERVCTSAGHSHFQQDAVSTAHVVYMVPQLAPGWAFIRAAAYPPPTYDMAKQQFVLFERLSCVRECVKFAVIMSQPVATPQNCQLEQDESRPLEAYMDDADATLSLAYHCSERVLIQQLRMILKD
eukprot:5726938-Amphidinium_carterae.1